MGCVELSGLPAGVRGEFLDQINVGIADHVFGYTRGTHIQLGLVEVFQQHLQTVVPIPGFPQIRLGIEVNITKHTFEGTLVGGFNGVQRGIDPLADIGFAALVVEGVEVGIFGQNESFAFQSAADTLVIVTELLAVFVVMIAPNIRDVLDEECHQDVILVDGGVHHAAKGVAGGPCGVIHVLLPDGIGGGFTAHCSVLPCCVKGIPTASSLDCRGRGCPGNA